MGSLCKEKGQEVEASAKLLEVNLNTSSGPLGVQGWKLELLAPRSIPSTKKISLSLRAVSY